MRQGPNTRRSRGRGNNSNGRRQNIPLRHQTFDSNGPDVRIRGNAYQVHEKYLALARDATASGDRIAAENYMQHAEHYYRIINQMNEGNGTGENARPPRQNRYDGNGNGAAPVYDDGAVRRDGDGEADEAIVEPATTTLNA